MSLTGLPDGEPGGGPMRVGVAVADLFTGMYTANAILAALYRREQTGEGATIDLALFDTQLAMLANQASNALVSGKDPQRQGAGHPNIVPYQPFAAADQPIIIAVGNDRQFAQAGGDPRPCRMGERSGLCDQCRAGRGARDAGADDRRDHRHASPPRNGSSSSSRRAFRPGRSTRISQALADPQAVHRGARISGWRRRAGRGADGRLADPPRRRARRRAAAAAGARRAWRFAAANGSMRTSSSGCSATSAIVG